MRTRAITRLGVPVAFVIVSFAPAAGEEELLKDGGKYLGWQGGKQKFVTCQNEPMDVGTGKVQQTSLKCPGQKPGTFSFFEGTVKAVNIENKTIHIEDDKGRSRELVVPAMNEGEGRLLRAGDKVSGSEGPVSGRVDSIKKKWN